MVRNFRLPLIFILGFFFTITYGRDFPHIQFENLTYDNGLPNNIVYQTVKDHKGFVWIGTSNGLVRYDSKNYKIFRHSEKDLNTPAGNQIKCLLIDSENYLWLGTQENGISRYNPATSNFIHFTSNENDPSSLSNKETLCMIEDSKGRIWVGTENGLNVLDKKTGKFTRFLHQANDSTSLSASAVLSILEDSSGKIWVGTWAGGLNLFQPNALSFAASTFKHFKHNSLRKESLSNNNVWSLFQDSQQRIWVGTFGGGLNLMIPSLKQDTPQNFETQFIHYQNSPKDKNTITNNDIYTIQEDYKHFLWVGTGHGLNILDLENIKSTKRIDANVSSTYPEITIKSHRPTMHNSSLVFNLIRNIYVENNEIWLSTLGGISKYNPFSVRFKSMLTPIQSNNNHSVTAILVDNESTHWLGIWDAGLIRHNPLSGELKIYKRCDGGTTALADADINDLFKDKSGNIWVGTSSGYSIFDVKKETFNNISFQDFNKEIHYGKVTDFFKDSRDRIWFATGSGLVRMYEENDSVKYHLYKKVPGNPNSLSHTEATHIAEDKHGNIWVTTWRGLNKIETLPDEELIFTRFLNDPDKPNSICNNRTTCIAIQGDQYWIGTEGGLSHYLPEEDKFINYRNEEGLRTTSITALEIDSEGQVWGATRQGLFRLNPQTGIFKCFLKEDGLQGNKFNFLSSTRDEKGALFFGGTTGYNTFLPSEIEFNQDVPKLEFTDFKIFNESVTFDRPLHELEEIELPYHQNYFTIQFAALSHVQPFRNQYAYMLEGFDEDWVYSNHRNFASYTNLNGGDYTFRIKASNNDGIWNEEGRSIKISVTPPYWQTWWFYVLVIASLMLGIYLFSYFRNKSILSRSRELEAFNANLNAQIKVRKQTEERLREREQKLIDTEKRLEGMVEELHRSNQELEQFAYIASHDLQEPLRMVGSFVQLLEKKYSDKIDDAGKEYINFAVDGVNRMSGLIKGLLSFSRVGRQHANFEKCNLNMIVEKKMLDIRKYIQERSAKINVEHLPEIVYCDPTQIGAIFYNLIVNAIKFNRKEQPTVDIQLFEEDQDQWTFKVSDNGIGISNEYQARVFEIFKRLNSTQEFKGSGIGLALCKRIIENHEGKIWFESVEGEGTTFFFSISKHLHGKNKTSREEVLDVA